MTYQQLLRLLSNSASGVCHRNRLTSHRWRTPLKHGTENAVDRLLRAGTPTSTRHRWTG